MDGRTDEKAPKRLGEARTSPTYVKNWDDVEAAMRKAGLDSLLSPERSQRNATMAAGTLAAVAAMHDGVRECMLLERTLAAEEGENR